MSQTTQPTHKARFMVGPSAEGAHELRTLYFGYGSNLSSTQMCARCSDSEAIGLGFLPGYRFIINQRGFANVIPIGAASAAEGHAEQQKESKYASSSMESPCKDEQGVYGVVYKLGEGDEELLDSFEGVSTGCYTKEMHNIQVSSASDEWKTKSVLVYIDRLRATEDVPRREYIARMNRGVDEAMREWCLPKHYVDSAIRPFISRTQTF